MLVGVCVKAQKDFIRPNLDFCGNYEVNVRPK